MGEESRVTRLVFDSRKAVEAIDFVAQRWRGVTVYYVCKIMYFADRDHCVDWGRTITGDRYVAMDHGPVPSRIYELLKSSSGEEDPILDQVHERVALEPDGQKTRIVSRGCNEFPSLSKTDQEYLQRAIDLCRPLSFARLRELSHAELPWVRATENNPFSNNPVMDLADWFEQENLDRNRGAKELLESARYGIH